MSDARRLVPQLEPAPKVESPRRPLVSEEQYQKFREVAPQVDPNLELALVLAHETGHRIGAVRQLRWTDIDLKTKRIRWRAETDKIRKEHVTPLSDVRVGLFSSRFSFAAPSSESA